LSYARLVSEPKGPSRPFYEPVPDDQEYDPYCPPQCGRPQPGQRPLPVRLAPDYMAELPLWGDWPLETRLPDELRDRLASWQAEFDENFGHDTGWATEEAKEHWFAQAEDLAAALRQVLDGKADLEVDLWPASPDPNKST
jgi:hypothetical protein